MVVQGGEVRRLRQGLPSTWGDKKNRRSAADRPSEGKCGYGSEP
jgi:hypothetical protein